MTCHQIKTDCRRYLSTSLAMSQPENTTHTLHHLWNFTLKLGPKPQTSLEYETVTNACTQLLIKQSAKFCLINKKWRYSRLVKIYIYCSNSVMRWWVHHFHNMAMRKIILNEQTNKQTNKNTPHIAVCFEVN